MIVYVVDVQEEDHNLYEELAWEEFHLLLRTLEEWYLLQKNQEDLNTTQKTEDPRESKLSIEMYASLCRQLVSQLTFPAMFRPAS